jgi:hypothetical protein
LKSHTKANFISRLVSTCAFFLLLIWVDKDATFKAMANNAQKKRALERIQKNIARSGQHIYIISGSATPRFAYTIGVSESMGVELILAGAVIYYEDDVTQIINDIAAQLKGQRNRKSFEVSGQGLFTLRKVHSSWSTELMVGAFDYYQKRDIPALQIVPDQAHWCIDVPDMRAPWSATKEPVWRWLYEAWTYPVPEEATAATNLPALRGDRITEVMRWEEDEWEAFAGAGPDVPEEQMRVVSLGTLIAVDESLAPALHLAIEKGIWRDPDPDSDWHPWHQSEQ